MNEQYIDKIHRFLSNSMDAAERETFAAEIQQDAALRSDVELEQLLLAGLEQAGAAQLRKTIGQVHQNLKTEGFFESATQVAPPPLRISHTSRITKMKEFISIAASLVLVAAAIWFFTKRNADANPNTIFAKNYQPQEDVQRAKSIIASLESYGLAGEQTSTDTLRNALQLYEAGKYNDALGLLNACHETHPENDTAQYYLAVIHISQEHYARAIELLLPLSRSATSALKNDALWNLGLCYLKMENGRKDAREAFTILSQDNMYSKQRGAKAVLDQLLPQ